MTRGPRCKDGGKTLPNGNCEKPASDGLPVQCVGLWASDKHYYLAQYIAATRSVRRKFLAPRGRGGAAFIDLFAGPGKARIRETGEIKDGSPLLALHHADAPFSKLIFCDTDPDNVHALGQRTASDSDRVLVVDGDCNAKIGSIVAGVPRHGLNVALVDPYGLKALKFAMLERLATFDRMDLIVHFPTGDIKRNLGQNASTRAWLTDALGTSSWAAEIKSLTEVERIIALFKRQLSSLGYGSQNVRSEPIKNNRNLTLYYLVYASKDPLGDKIWQSITKNKPTGQRGLF